MSFALAVLLSIAFSVQTPGRVVTLTLPHDLGKDERAWVELRVGAIERGAEIEVSTVNGESLGTISPFGIRSGEEAGTYTLPLPADAISNRHVTLRLTLSFSGEKRAPNDKEVQSVHLKITTQKS